MTETMLIANRSLYTYVGAAAEAATPPITLRLSIPSEFTKVTFDKEFFGRQFQLINGAIVTQIPWTPGQRAEVHVSVTLGGSPMGSPSPPGSAQ